MAPTFTYPELNSDQSQVTDDGIRNLANTAADFACDLWENYSEWTSGFADPTGIGKFNNALFSRLCKPRGKQPQQGISVTFTGGQCAKYYNCQYNITSGEQSEVVSGTIFNVLGPIKGIVTKPGNVENQVRLGIQGGIDINHPDGFWGIRTGLKTSVLPYTVNSFIPTPVSGPDNCGDPEPQYPPKTPGPNDVKKNVNVNIGAGVVVPVAAVFAPVIFRPDVDINPQFQVELGPFNVTFDAGGVTVSPNVNIGTEPKTLPSPSSYPVSPVPSKEQKVECKATDLSPVITRLVNIEGKVDALDAELDDIKECACPVGYTTSVVAGGSGNSGVVAMPQRTIQVRLNLTTIPANPKTIQSGGANAPLQYFCGYYSFGDGTNLGARTAINVAQSVFEVPTWATSFSWSLYDGYVGSVSFVTLVPEKEGAQLATRQLKMPPA